MASASKGFSGKSKRHLKHEAMIKKENRKLDLARKLQFKAKSS
jgi:hypothetical protein